MRKKTPEPYITEEVTVAEPVVTVLSEETAVPLAGETF